MCLMTDEDSRSRPSNLNFGFSEPSWVSQHLAHIIKQDSPQDYDFVAASYRHQENMEFDSPKHLENMEFDGSINMKNMDFYQTPMIPEFGKKKKKDKKLHGIKKKIRKFEQEYAMKLGYKPTHSDKMNNKEIKKLISEKVKIENSIQIKNDKKELKNKKAFMEFGESFGYPETLEDANCLYERYRIQVKRMARRSSSVISWESQSDLETIPEDRDIPLTLASPPQRIILEVTLPDKSKENKQEYPDSGQNNGDIIGAHISVEELLGIQEQYKIERNSQRKVVKDLEKEFERESGRELTEKEKDVRKNYEDYKKAKGKVKLIDALLNKMFDNSIDEKNV